MKHDCMKQSWALICMREFFPCLSIASVDGKQHELGSFYCCSLIFIVRKMTGSGSYPYTQDSSVIVFMKSGSAVCEVQHVLRVLDVQVRPGTCHYPYNENPMRAIYPTSLKCCLPSTDAIDKWEKFRHAYESSRSPHASALYWNPPGFRKKKVWYFSNRVV